MRNTKEEQFPKKNVNFYFTRSQAAKYDAALATFSDDESESDIESDLESTLSSEYDDDESLLSYESENQWEALAIYGERLKLDLSKLKETYDLINHVENYGPSLDDIQRAPERKALHQERSMLTTELKGFQQLATQLEGNYRNQKVKCYNQSTGLSVFFRSDQPTQARMDSIAQIQSIIAAVKSDLNHTQVDPKNFSNTDPLMAMKYHNHHLEQATLVIKGAALREFSAINNTYTLQSADNSALHNVLQKTFNCAEMPAQEQAAALAALNKFEAKMDANQRLDSQAQEEQPRAFSV